MDRVLPTRMIDGVVVSGMCDDNVFGWCLIGVSAGEWNK